MSKKPAPRPAPPKPAPTAARRPPPPPPRQTAARPPAAQPPQRQAAPPPERNAPQSGTAVATRAAASNVPAHLRERIAQSTGKGVSKDASDNLVPLIYVLQEQSPQAQSRDPRYIENAVAGNFWLRGMDPPLIDGENEGMLAQPCYFNKVVIEWQPNRGGFVARHATMPEDAQQVEDPQDPNIKRWVSPEGNYYVETREHVVRIHLPDGRRVPFVLPFSSTGHTVSRGWMFDMNQKQVDGNTVDTFCLLYRLKTKYSTNKKGSWFKITVDFEDWIQEAADIDAGETIYNAFASGEKEVDTQSYTEGTEDQLGAGDDGQSGGNAGDTDRPGI
jgi:hypothetical protein